jgi:hypothetical protein
MSNVGTGQFRGKQSLQDHAYLRVGPERPSDEAVAQCRVPCLVFGDALQNTHDRRIRRFGGGLGCFDGSARFADASFQKRRSRDFEPRSVREAALDGKRTRPESFARVSRSKAEHEACVLDFIAERRL